jgi:glycolate oxidase FAD binding subunit
MVTHTPQTPEEVADIVAGAAASHTPLAITGHGTRAGIGRPSNVTARLVTTALAGMVMYEPEELVFTARAGTPLEEIEAALARRGQMLAFEPPRLHRLFGKEEDAGTLGGMTASGLAGPRRLRSGGVRDHLLGFLGVNGRGEIFRSGGRVMKNVTGYDLSKLMCGSWGTLVVLCELTFKVLPRPETERTLLWKGQDAHAANALMTAAMKTPWEVSSAAFLPRGAGVAGEGPLTLLRVEGFARSVQARCEALARELGEHGAADVLPQEESRKLWQEIRDVLPLAGLPRDFAIWRISCPPAAGAGILAAIRESRPQAEAFLDWAGGLIWLAVPLPASPDEARTTARAIRAPLAATGGHATLIRAPADVRAMVDVFHPQPAPLAALRERVRKSFDPSGILEPGRMYPPAGD